MHLSTVLDELLSAVRSGTLSVAQAADRLREQVLDQHADAATALGFAVVDQERVRRCGAGEVLYGAGKTAEQIVQIAEAVLVRRSMVLITRCAPDVFTGVEAAMRGKGHSVETAARSGALLVGTSEQVSSDAIPIVTAGTSDLPVAEEAALTCKALGHPVDLIADVGVAGLHRLLSRIEQIREGNVILVVAGMEAALPSVVGGLVDKPIIGVPTSVGYGAHLNGLAALLGMLNSCASGLTVVNIDNGFGAAYAACRINALASSRQHTDTL
jgi:hypothetical protein